MRESASDAHHGDGEVEERARAEKREHGSRERRDRDRDAHDRRVEVDAAPVEPEEVMRTIRDEMELIRRSMGDLRERIENDAAARSRER